MLKTGTVQFKRLLAFMLTIVLLSTAWTLPAKAQGKWDELFISVTWIANGGEPMTAVAAPVAESETPAFWLTLDPSLLGTMLQLEVFYPDPEYRFYLNTGDLFLQWEPELDAQSLDDQYACYMSYDYQGVFQNEFIKLYISSGMMPETQPPVEAFTPAPALQSAVTVRYVLEDGTLLDEQVRMLDAGDHTIWPESSSVGGLELASEASVYVYADPSGFASPDTVTFTYRQPYVAPAEATITVYYYHENGTLLDSRDVTLPEGTHTLWPESSKVSGLELVGDVSANVTVYADGGTDVASVTFLYKDPYVAPAEATITVYYYHENGTLLDQQEEIRGEGTHALWPKSDKVDGLELVTDPLVNVTVYADGSTDLASVSFIYRDPYVAPVSVPVTVQYLDTMGETIAAPVTKDYAPGTYPFTAPAIDGYELMTDAVINVTVYEDGTIDPEEIAFYYRPAQPTEPPAPVSVPVTVQYLDTMGETIAAPVTKDYAPGTYPFTAPAIDGYELMTDAVINVTVYEDGTIAPEEIAFYYRPAPKYAEVPVTYTDRSGRILVETFVLRLEPGRTHTVAADPALVPAGYDASSAVPVEVRIDAHGNATPDRVYLDFAETVVETPIPVGQPVGRYADLNAKKVAFRQTPDTSGSNIITRYSRGDTVYVVRELYDEKGRQWAEIIAESRVGYMMSEFIEVKTQAESDRYAASIGATPVPTFTPQPTATTQPTETPDQGGAMLITPPVVTATPTPTPYVPTMTPTAAPYMGYALTNRITALRTGISNSDMSIIHNMDANQLVRVSGQMYAADGRAWSIVTTLSGQSGYVQDADLRYVSDAEAAYYIDVWQQQQPTAEPTKLPTNTPAPVQQQGYAITIADQVPLRTMTSEYSSISAQLPWSTVVFVTGQTVADNVTWHSVQYSGVSGGWGYIRADLVRMMTAEEVSYYLSQSNPTPTPTYLTTNNPYDEQGLSSYGYVDTGSVNFRESPSMQGKRIGEIKRYGLCLVLGTQKVDGVTWYNVRYGTKTGYIHGDYFHQLRINELNDFLNSDEYRQGIANNSSSAGSGSTGVGGTGGLVPEEDQTISQWQGHVTPQISYEPFNPIATVAPITGTTRPTLEPLPGQMTATPAAGTTFQPWSGWQTGAPTATPTLEPFPTVTYPTVTENDGSSILVWIIVIVLLLIVAGVVFFIVQNNRNRRKVAMRAAQRRAQAARTGAANSYYGAGGSQPRTGRYPDQYSAQPRRPYGGSNFARPQAGTDYDPYAGGENFDELIPPTPATGKKPAAAPTSSPAAPQGRRSAYQQRKKKDPLDEEF